MFYSHQLLARKAPLGQIWMAATLHAKINRRKLDKLNIIKICEEILNPSVPMALRLSGILMGGVVIVYERKVKLLYDDVSRLLVELNEAWKIKQTVVADPTLLPKSKSQAKHKAVTLPAIDDAGDLTAAIEQSLNFSGFQQPTEGYVTMRLDRIDEGVINNEMPKDDDLLQNHHQADAANITLLDPLHSFQQDTSLLDRFERFDIEGDEDTQTNFATQDCTRIPSPIPSPPHSMIPDHPIPSQAPQQVPLQPDDIQDLYPEQQNNQRSDECREEVLQAQPNEQKPRETKRRGRTRTCQVPMDYEQTIIPGHVYQSWLQNPTDILSRRGRNKKHNKPLLSMKTAHLMELPPAALLSGFSGFGTTEVHYPMPLLDLYMRCTKNQPPHESSSSRGRNSPPQAPAPAPSSPLAPTFNQNPLDFPVEDFYSGVDSHPKQVSIEKRMAGSHPKQVSIEKQMAGSNPKQVSIEKQMEQLNIFEIPVNELDMTITPGNSAGSNGRSVPSSASGNDLVQPEPVTLERSSRKRPLSSSRHSVSSGLDPVAEENPLDLLEPNFKLRRLSENAPFDDQEMLMETGPTQTPLPLLDHPIDKITDAVRMHLKTHFDTPGVSATESLNHLTSGMNPKRAALLFYQTCVLATHNILRVQQMVPYGDILISKGSKM